MSDNRAGEGEGPDAGADGKTHDENEDGNPHKAEDAAKAGRDDFDTDVGAD